MGVWYLSMKSIMSGSVYLRSLRFANMAPNMFIKGPILQVDRGIARLMRDS